LLGYVDCSVMIGPNPFQRGFSLNSCSASQFTMELFRVINQRYFPLSLPQGSMSVPMLLQIGGG
ncbi:MAG TPA: hypothetical protein PLV88_06150, partial [Methanoregulaceae archaeon]|nr:hypothetical protein [Methanoregulaceae archaeon]